MIRQEIKQQLTPKLLLRAYASGIFPMSKSHNDPNIYWVEPEMRGVLPLNQFHIPKSLKKVIRKQKFEIFFDRAFEQVLDECAEPSKSRDVTWINKSIRDNVIKLYEMGFAHSVECWHHNKLVGGLYGISLGAAFFGESMFSKETNASKVALVYLIARMRSGGFKLLDTQFTTGHLSQFGVIEIPSDQYLKLLDEALKFQGVFASSFDQMLLNETIEIMFNLDH
jgi:leucyl/phenylalanyl-tRNA--protein transferase